MRMQIDPMAQISAKRHIVADESQNGASEKRIKLSTASRDQAESSKHASSPMNDFVAVEEDQDDRFFGGGLSEEQIQAMNFLDSRDQEVVGPVQALDKAGLRKIAAQFERASTKNQQMRTRYADDPIKFLNSEFELDKQTKQLSVLSEYPALYEEFVKLGSLNSLIGLISHENIDIAYDAIQILAEMTDEETRATDEEFQVLMNGLRSSHALEILTQNLSRLKETNQVDNDAIFQTLTIMENVVNIDSGMQTYIFSQAKALPWLMATLKSVDIDEEISPNKQYTAELLSILLQNCPDNIIQFIEADGVDTVLVLLAFYRKSRPRNSLEEEYLENLFDILDILIGVPEGKDKFLDGEGVELMQRMLLDAEGPKTRHRALQSIEYGCASWSGGAVCAQVVEVGLLSSLFSMFMKKNDPEMLKTCLGIFVSFFRTLNDGEAERLRVITKFFEKDHQKVIRLLDIRSQFKARHHAIVKEQKLKKGELAKLPEAIRAEYEFTRYLDRLENGLDGLQLTDTILAWLMASDVSAKLVILASPHHRVHELRETLIELQESLKVDEDEQRQDGEVSSEKLEQRQEYDLLQFLVEVVSIDVTSTSIS